MSKQTKELFVYIIKDIGTGWYKVDRAYYLPKRKPNRELICIIHSNNAWKLRDALHKEFKQYQVKGKWFSLNQEIIEKLKKENSLAL